MREKEIFLRSFLLMFLFLFTLQITVGAVKIYPIPVGLKSSDVYRVFINEQEVFVYDSPVPAAYCSFDMNSGVEIVIKVNRDVKWVDVRPLAAGVIPIFKDSTIRLYLKKPMQLSIELNGSIKMPLFIFANSFEKNIPSKNDPNVLFFEAGKMYHPGIITLKDNQTLYVEGGAFVTAVIEANNAKNIRICGRGVLDGTYNYDFDDALIKAGTFSEKTNEEGKKYHRFINLRDCENVTVEGVTMHNSTSWDVVPIHCNKVHIDNIKIVSDNASDDGIDIVRSRNVLIENCFIRTKDDCIAIKTLMDYPKSEGIDSVLVRHCIFWNAAWGNGLEIGFELNSLEVKNIRFIDNDIIHVEAGAAISIHNAGTATVSDLIFENIRIEDVRQKLFDLAIFRSQYSDDGTHDEAERKKLYLNGVWDGVLSVPPNEKEAHAKFRGHIQNVLLKNIQIIDGGLPFSIFYGSDNSHKVKQVTIKNLTLHGKRITSLKDAKFYLENTSDIKIQ
ncbi:MAG: glycosyl hydrolase family 28 protein [Ginsengibacter sp.]